MMPPHDEDWELAPENGHPSSRALLSEEFYWDCVPVYEFAITL